MYQQLKCLLESALADIYHLCQLHNFEKLEGVWSFGEWMRERGQHRRFQGNLEGHIQSKAAISEERLRTAGQMDWVRRRPANKSKVICCSSNVDQCYAKMELI